MKRRIFIKGSILGLGVSSSAASQVGRLYGKPATQEKAAPAQPYAHIAVPLSRSQLPPAMLNELLEHSEIWRNALTNSDYRAKLMADPDSVAQRLRLTGESTATLTKEMIALISLWDPIVTKSIAERDYRGYLDRLKKYMPAAVANPRVPLDRTAAINHKLQSEGVKLLADYKVAGLKLEVPEDAIRFSEGQELRVIASSICSGGGGAFVGAVVVAIVAAVAATYVSVGVNVTVAVNAGVWLNVAVKASVATSVSSARDAEASSKDDIEALERIIANSDVPDLSDEDYNSLLATIKIASLKGDKVLASLTAQELILREIDVAFKAAEDLEIIHIYPPHRESLIRVSANYVLQFLNLPRLLPAS